MELSDSTLKGLSLLGEEAKIPAAAYKELLICVSKDVTSSLETSITKLDESSNLAKIDQSIAKEAYSAAMIVVFESAKLNLDSPGLGAILEDAKIDQKRIELFCKMYDSKKTDVRILLGSNSFNFAHVVDIDWRLDYYIKSQKLEKINKAQYFISLKCEENDGQNKNIEFSATLEELQDLVNKLKDASKSFQTIYQG